MGKTLSKLDQDLLTAVEHSNLEEAHEHLIQGANPNAHEGGEPIPRYLLGQIDEPKTFLAMGYSLNRRPLHLALLGRHESLALELLERGADPEASSHLGETAPHLAARGNAVSVLQALQAKKVKLDKADRSRSTPLMEACRSGSQEAVEWLLAQGAKAERKNRDGETPLYIACSTCQPNIVDSLLSNGADPNTDTQFGPAIVAAAGACRLVPHDPRRPPYISTTWNDDGVWTYAPFPEDQIMRMIESLLAHGAHPSGSKKNSPVGAAAQAGLLKVVQRLIEAGANPRAQDFLGNTPLDLAKLFNRDSIVDYLSKYTSKVKPKSPKKKQKKTTRNTPKASYAPIPKFTTKLRKGSFKKSLDQLAKRCRANPVFFDNHVEFHVDSELQSQLSLVELQDEYLDRGFFLFERTGANKATKLALIPSSRWQDAIAVLQTDGINYDIASQDIIDWLERWEETNPFRVLGISHDIVSGTLTQKLKKPKTFAKSMYELCPDTVEQGLGSLEELEFDLKSNRRFFLWWD